ncbi:PREDICTED: Na(+)/H(+) exchange regulatory cofactor NHE-RF4 isoform X3 [Chinchilla lanigera]|uniref:Na(+)/H(+) exchange regulatory cofactor NHE-RF4 isoform X3 n=1 Tax=Chinchilla lanigera TaxID=34839 RepID=UPI0006976DBB|nr:PREDICTED: Na(+)/H(+) exchange regulatory cofactor NHE-RF4 isoform X3 [Chinchilla lanigera]
MTWWPPRAGRCTQIAAIKNTFGTQRHHLCKWREVGQGEEEGEGGGGSSALAWKRAEAPSPAASLFCLSCLLAGSLSLTPSWVLIIQSSAWPKTTTTLVTLSCPLTTAAFPWRHRSSHSFLSPWQPLCLPLISVTVQSGGGGQCFLCPRHDAHTMLATLPNLSLDGGGPWQEAVVASHAMDLYLGCGPPLPLSYCPSPPPDPWNLERPRFCLLSKEEGTSFGFHLQHKLGRAGHEVCRVEPGTSAHRQGLRAGDQILAVNNSVVEHEDYAVVVRHIRASGPRVLLTVLARHVYDVARAQQGNDAHLCPVLGSGVRPRLCHVVKDEGGFGFSVTHGAQGPFWLVLSAGGAADRAGVPPGARLLEVNGVSVEKFTHNQLSKKMADAVPRWVPTALAEWKAGDSAGGRARGGGTVSPAGDAPSCTPGRGLGTARQAPLPAPREGTQGLWVPSPGGKGHRRPPWAVPAGSGPRTAGREGRDAGRGPAGGCGWGECGGAGPRGDGVQDPGAGFSGFPHCRRP